MAKMIRMWGPPLAAALPALYVTLVGAMMTADPSWFEAPTDGILEPARAPGLGLLACGIGLLAAAAGRARLRSLRYAAAVATLAVGAAGAFQIAAEASFPLPMSPTAAAGLILAAILLLVYDRPRHRMPALAVQLAIGVFLAIAMVSIIGQDANEMGVLPWYRWSRMRPATAGALLAAAIALLALAGRSRWYETVYAGREDEKILILALGILSLLAVGMGVAAFVAIENNLERSVHGTLTQTVADRATFLDSLFANRITRASIIGKRPSVLALLHEHGTQTRAALYKEAMSYLDSGFSALAILDADGRMLAVAGELIPDDSFGTPIANPRADVRLMWNEVFVLRVATPVWDGERRVGTVVSDQVLDLLPRLQNEVRTIGQTAEWVLCAPRGEQMACFPRRFAAWPEVLPRRYGREAVPMDYALRGERGIAVAPDYRGVRVIAAYAPVSGTQLGVVLKMGLDEFYEPLRDELRVWWRWYFAVVLVGALLVASQVRPVAQRLVRSEAMARQRSEVLARSERTLRDLYTALADGILVLSPEGLIEFANPAAARIFGYGPQALVGRPVAELIPEELREANARATQRFLDEGTSNVVDAGASFVFPAVRRDGSRFDVEFSLARMRQGDELRLVAVVRDVSERTALARMKSEFTAAVSHELRTPLTSVIGSLEMLREEAEIDGPPAELLDMALRNSRRLATLVDDVIDAERIESGALRFTPSRFALPALLEEAVDLNQAYAATHGVTFALEKPIPDGTLEADRDRLMQVLANLLSNAAKFSPAGSEVTLRAEDDGRHVRIEVCDRGSGIPEAFKPRVFDKFAQADSTDARKKGGTGLGLSICKAIVERMGGKIGFRDREGGGTVFWLELPVAG